MKKLLLLSLLAGCAPAPAGTTARDASRAPGFQLAALDGTTVKSDDLWSSRPVLLVFMTSWCSACRAEVPRLNEIARSHRVVAISTGDSREAVQKCREASGITYPILLDEGAVAKAYAVEASPTCILVDKGGEILYRGNKPPENLK